MSFDHAINLHAENYFVSEDCRFVIFHIFIWHPPRASMAKITLFSHQNVARTQFSQFACESAFGNVRHLYSPLAQDTFMDSRLCSIDWKLVFVSHSLQPPKCANNSIARCDIVRVRHLVWSSLARSSFFPSLSIFLLCAGG